MRWAQHVGQVADDLQLVGAACFAGDDPDGQDQGAQRLLAFSPCDGVAGGQARLQVLDITRILGGGGRVKVNDVGRGQALQLGVQLGPLRLQLVHARLDQCAGQDALLDLVQQAVGASADLFQLAFDRRPGRAIGRRLLALQLLEFADGRLDDGRMHQVLADGAEDPGLDLVHLGGAAVAADRRPLLLAVAALDAAARARQDHRPFTTAAAHQARQEALGPAFLGDLQVGAGLASVARLDGLPEAVIHQAQVRDGCPDDRVRRALPGPPGSGLTVLAVGMPPPNQIARVEGVMEDAVSSLGVAVDRRGVPGAATGGGYPLGVQLRGDGPGRDAGDVLAQDPAHDVGFGLVDLEQPGDQLAVLADLPLQAVAVHLAAGVAALARHALKAAPGLRRVRFQEQVAHGAQDADMHPGQLAVGDGVDLDAQAVQLVEHVPGPAARSGQAVQVFGDDQVEGAGAGVGQQLLQAGPRHQAKAGDGRVVILAGHGRADPLGMAPAGMQLVVDGFDVLQLGAETGVKRGAHGY